MKRAFPYRILIAIGAVILLVSLGCAVCMLRNILLIYGMLGEGDPQIEKLAPFVERALFQKLGMIISLTVGFLLVYLPRKHVRRTTTTQPKIPNTQIHTTV